MNRSFFSTYFRTAGSYHRLLSFSLSNSQTLILMATTEWFSSSSPSRVDSLSTFDTFVSTAFISSQSAWFCLASYSQEITVYDVLD
jgi:hypothetical protein